jgi:hypothetical protein
VSGDKKGKSATYHHLTGQIPHGPGEERPRVAGDVDDPRVDLTNLVTDLAVNGVMVLATQKIVPHPGRVRHVSVDLG